MFAKPAVIPRPQPRHPFWAAAASAGAITIGILASVIELFLRDGLPMERLAAAERACVGHAHVSEREACMREWAAARQTGSVASK